MPTHETAGISKKCSKACNRCRLTKVRCSGTQPCTRCTRRNEQCIFAADEKRVSIPESYLRELERQYQSSRSPTSSSPQERRPSNSAAMVATPPSSTGPSDEKGASKDENNAQIVLESEPEFRQNPLVDYDFSFGKAAGKFWYLGPSSSWSFCRRVFAVIGQRLPEGESPPVPWNLDGATFPMQWETLAPYEQPDTSNLPPMDYALFLYNTAKFYLGTMVYFIDEPSFMRNLHELYENPAAKARTARHWYAKYLLFLAFGKAITSPRDAQLGPAGHHYALRAMKILPQMSTLPADTMDATQALCLAALYLQSVDMRIAAFQLVGQALRTLILEGMHRHMPEEVAGTEYSRRCNVMFWAVYMLDREFSSTIGTPSSIRDEDITVKLPSETDDSIDALNMTLHVRLSRLRARILTTVYGPDENGALVTNTQAILRNLAEVLKDLNTLLGSHFQGSVNKASRMSIRLVLGYHHCVVLSTRPLVMCALHMQLERGQTHETHGTTLSPPVESLIYSCVESAQAILRILRILADEDLLEGFLPFQLDDAFSSAFILHLIQFIVPSLVPDTTTWRDNVRIVLDTMVRKGSITAHLRIQELNQLEQTLSSLSTQGRSSIASVAAVDTANNQPAVSTDNVAAGFGQEALMDDPGWDFFLADRLGALSPHAIMDLADQLDTDILDSTESISQVNPM